MSPRLRMIAVLVFVCLLIPRALRADDQPPEGAKPIVVATHAYPPWVMHDPDGTWRGIAIDVWKIAARDAGITYTFKDIEPADIMAKGLDQLGIDVVVAGLSANPRTEKKMDVTHPFLVSGLSIATRSETGSGVSRILTKVASWRFLRNLGLLLAIIVVIGVVVWRIERESSPDEFGGPPLRGIGGGVLWTVESIFGKPKPLSRRLRSRFVALFWVLVCMVLISGVTAKLAAEFTVNQLTGTVAGPNDLPHARVGAAVTPQGVKSTSARYLEAHGIGYRGLIVDNVTNTGLLEVLDRGEVDAVVDDTISLRYAVTTQHSGQIIVLPGSIEPKEFAFGLRLGSPLRKQLDLAILTLRENGDVKPILLRYLGSSE